MKKIVALIWLLLVSCSAPVERAKPPDEKSTIAHVQDSTVILLRDGGDGFLYSSCSGVWVGNETILTANHCVDKVGSITKYKAWSDVSESDKLREYYLTYNESIVIATDSDNDLALLTSADAPPKHSRVTVSKAQSSQGDKVHVVGNGSGLVFTYIPGIVSKIRTMDTSYGSVKTIQISAPIWFGYSGCGAFNQSGELIGICSFLYRKAPSFGFFIHTEAVKSFLDKNIIE